MSTTLDPSKVHFKRYMFAVESIASAIKTRNKEYPFYKSICDENVKSPFKSFLLKRIMNLWTDKRELSKEEMLAEIISLKLDSEKDYRDILYKGEFRLGIGQKLICLFAKFLWVSGQLTIPPPLIPYDSVVKKLLNDDTLTDWTVLDCRTEYEKITNRIEEVSKNNPAEWELINWNESLLN